MIPRALSHLLAASLLTSLAACGGADSTQGSGGGAGHGGASTSSGGTSATGGRGGATAGSGGVGGATGGGGATSGTGGTMCDPPNTMLVDGACVPSCGVAGGNTCTDGSTTLCVGLPQLTSYDCPVCCFVYPYPAVPPAGFEIIAADPAFQPQWDSIAEMVAAYDGPTLASQKPPAGVPKTDWTQNITTTYGFAQGAVDPTPFDGDAAKMAAFVHSQFQLGAEAPARIMVDELNSGTIDLVAAFADAMRTQYPQWKGRWGAYLVHGNNVGYPGLNPAIDALLSADAVLAPEMYPKRSDYCAAGNTAGERDQWLEDFYRGAQGAFPQGRFRWLNDRRASLASASQLAVLFGVTDTYMTGVNPGIFLDRMFYVWVTRSQFPSVLALANGGAGSWKWHDQSPSSRDALFRDSFVHYSVDGKTTSRLGQVPCP